MTIGWLLQGASSVPERDDWLSTSERQVLAGLRFPKRRLEWRLGRFTAKRALASLVGLDRFDRIEIIAAEDGAPEARIEGAPFDSSLSISHRDGIAACAVASGVRVGCDLEAIEPRTARFVADYFTPSERGLVAIASPDLRTRQVALTWSAKESALKALRVGLRRDTRSVEIELGGSETSEAGWSRLRATVIPEQRMFGGWWRQEANLVLTVVCDSQEVPAPTLLGVAGHDEQR